MLIQEPDYQIQHYFCTFFSKTHSFMMLAPVETQLDDKVKIWFEGFMHILRTDYVMMEQNVATPQKAAFYNLLANGDANDINFVSRQQSSVHFLQRLVVAYLDELQRRHALPSKLAMGLSNAKILVWAEIGDDDEALEDQLRLAEAKVNAQFDEFGFHLTSTIVEQSDDVAIPSHYQPILS
jgi:hypothetical protein